MILRSPENRVAAKKEDALQVRSVSRARINNELRNTATCSHNVLSVLGEAARVSSARHSRHTTRFLHKVTRDTRNNSLVGAWKLKGAHESRRNRSATSTFLHDGWSTTDCPTRRAAVTTASSFKLRANTRMHLSVRSGSILAIMSLPLLWFGSFLVIKEMGLFYIYK